jgi:hypothetical protein
MKMYAGVEAQICQPQHQILVSGGLHAAADLPQYPVNKRLRGFPGKDAVEKAIISYSYHELNTDSSDV